MEMWSPSRRSVRLATAVAVLIVSFRSSVTEANSILDAFLPGPPLPDQIDDLKEQLELLKDFFSSSRLIVRIKDEYKDQPTVFSDVTNGTTVEFKGEKTGLQVLSLKAGFDIIQKLLDLRSLDVFDFVEMDFKQQLADTLPPHAEVSATSSASGGTQDVWEDLSDTFGELLNLKEEQGTDAAANETAGPLAVTPTDEAWAKQWSLRKIGMDHAWPLLESFKAGTSTASAGGDEIIVAILDTGVDYTHPDLQGMIWINEAELNGLPGVDDDGNGCIDDVHGCNIVGQDIGIYDVMDGSGHGTHCAGTIAAVQNNTIGIAGIASNVKIMAVKIFGDSGTGYDSDAIKGIEYAIKMGASVISNSWTAKGSERLGVKALETAVNASYAAGQVFVAAAGNNGADLDVAELREYPAGLGTANIISVLAMNDDNDLASFDLFSLPNMAASSSNYGRLTVDLAAPGTDIYSTLPGGEWGYKSGTSMAAPHVAGVAAVVLQQLHANGNLTGASPEDRALLTKAVMLYSTIYDEAMSDLCLSKGYLNAYGSVVAAQEGMSGDLSKLLFPDVPDPTFPSMIYFYEANKGIILAVGIAALLVVVAVCCCCICCCVRRKSGSEFKNRI